MSPDRRSCTPADLHKPVRAKMTVPVVVDWPVRVGRPRGPGGTAAASYRVTRSPGRAGLILPEDRAGRVHRLAGAGIRSRARCPPRAGTVASGHGKKDVTGGFVLGASQERGDRDELVLAPRCVRGHWGPGAGAGLAAGSAE